MIRESAGGRASSLPARPSTSDSSLRCTHSSARALTSPKSARDTLESLSKIKVVLHANVTGIVASPHGDAVDCVTARDIEGHELSVAAEHFVVCCGGIETARLLLSSNSRSEGGIGNGYDLVGRYFQDHPGFSVGEITGEAAREHFRPRKEGGIKYLPLIRAAEQWQAKTESLNCGASVVFEGARLPGVEAGKSLVTALRERRFGRAELGELRRHRPPPPPARHGCESLLRAWGAQPGHLRADVARDRARAGTEPRQPRHARRARSTPSASASPVSTGAWARPRLRPRGSSSKR